MGARGLVVAVIATPAVAANADAAPTGPLDPADAFLRAHGFIHTDAGEQVAAVGDFDDDGVSDFLVVAPDGNYNDTWDGIGPWHSGVVWVVPGGRRGSFPLDERHAIRIDGRDVGGWRLIATGAGDFNGDGFADVLVSRPGSDALGENLGAMYVVFGGPDVRHVRIHTWDGSQTGGVAIRGARYWSGTSVAGLGDVDRAGYDDVANRDSAYVVPGRRGTATVSLAAPESAVRIDRITLWPSPKAPLAAAADVAGDGGPDLIVGWDGAYVLSGDLWRDPPAPAGEPPAATGRATSPAPERTHRQPAVPSAPAGARPRPRFRGVRIDRTARRIRVRGRAPRECVRATVATGSRRSTRSVPVRSGGRFRATLRLRSPQRARLRLSCRTPHGPATRTLRVRRR
jgi:hypothetical protein